MATTSIVSRAKVKQIRVFDLTAAYSSVAIPAGHAISQIYYRNRTANAVTGGLKIGTTEGGTEVVVAQSIGASGIGAIASADIVVKLFSMTARTVLYIDAVSAFNSAELDLYIVLHKLQP